MKLPQYRTCVYLDYNATTPIFPEVLKIMEETMRYCFGNPSSPHCFGKSCKNVLEAARKNVSSLVHATDPSSIVFTASGSECDNRAIDIAISYAQENNPHLKNNNFIPHIISCTIEHPAILLYLKDLEQRHIITLSLINVDCYGVLHLYELEEALQVQTALVTIMHANNEVGTLQPLYRISQLITKFNEQFHTKILFHTDAAQSIGKVQLDVSKIQVDMATIVGHKFGASKGVAALYINPAIRNKCRPMMIGGSQEGGMRAGTESVILIAGLGEASRLAEIEAAEVQSHMMFLRQRIIDGLREGLKDIDQ
eukprot:gene11804-24727_t